MCDTCYILTYISLLIGFLMEMVRAVRLSSIFFCRLEGFTSTTKSGLTFFLYCSRWRRPFMCISLAFGSLNRHSHNLQLNETTLPRKKVSQVQRNINCCSNHVCNNNQPAMVFKKNIFIPSSLRISSI